jgi:hypothetical protein
MRGPTDPAPVDTSFALLELGSELSYLPDPMAVFVAARFFNHPGSGPETVVQIPLYPNGRQWPEAQAVRIHCYEAVSPTATPTVSQTASGMLLRVPLPKSARVQLRLSTMLSKSALEQLGVWQWLLKSSEWTSLPGMAKDTLLRRALKGQHWMLSPWRTVELVHAVQRPLLTPDFAKHNATTLFKFASRTRGDTFVWPIFIQATHIASTERLDLLAEWARASGYTCIRSLRPPAHRPSILAPADNPANLRAEQRDNAGWRRARARHPAPGGNYRLGGCRGRRSCGTGSGRCSAYPRSVGTRAR